MIADPPSGIALQSLDHTGEAGEGVPPILTAKLLGELMPDKIPVIRGVLLQPKHPSSKGPDDKALCRVEFARGAGPGEVFLAGLRKRQSLLLELVGPCGGLETRVPQRVCQTSCLARKWSGVNRLIFHLCVRISVMILRMIIIIKLFFCSTPVVKLQ